MNRRAILAALASLPFIGRLVPAMAAENFDLNPEALVEGEIELLHGNIYAHAGETVTCENGHLICDFVETVKVGQMQDVARQFGTSGTADEWPDMPALPAWTRDPAAIAADPLGIVSWSASGGQSGTYVLPHSCYELNGAGHPIKSWWARQDGACVASDAAAQQAER